MDQLDATVTELQEQNRQLRAQLGLAEQALSFERRHNAFLFGLLLGRHVPIVRPARSLRARCGAALADLLAGPGRG